MNFKANEYDDEDKYLLAMERLYARKDENEVKHKKWFSTWMMIETKKRKGIESFQLQELRNIVKTGGEEVMNEFRDKYRELKIESNREKTTDSYYMGNRSLSRQRFHNERTRRDSQGRDYYQERNGRNDSRGRQYHRRYYRRESRAPRDFPRDMRSFSRQRNNSREERGRSGSRREEKRSVSRENGKKEYKDCVGCKCEDCVKMR